MANGDLERPYTWRDVQNMLFECLLPGSPPDDQNAS
jgi:hypothetical protein